MKGVLTELGAGVWLTVAAAAGVMFFVVMAVLSYRFQKNDLRD